MTSRFSHLWIAELVDLANLSFVAHCHLTTFQNENKTESTPVSERIKLILAEWVKKWLIFNLPPDPFLKQE